MSKHQLTYSSEAIISDDIFYNQFGAIRLAFVRKYFGLISEEIGLYTDKNGHTCSVKARIQTKQLSSENLTEITRLCKQWHDLDEYMSVRYTYRDEKIIDATELYTSAEINTRHLQTNGIKASYCHDFVFYEGTRSEWAFHKSCKRGNSHFID
ncbi:MAG: hypothetical protein KAR55_02665 [Thermoplasmatales archaeon]|nr:hypothetical protein [Thermoplasmatales archaeon]